MTAAGSWTVVTESPMGKQTMDVVLEEVGAVLTGTATTPDETLTITDGSADGDKLTWKVKVSKPLPMGLVYKVVLDGDTLTGTAKAGIFPAVDVTGTRA